MRGHHFTSAPPEGVTRGKKSATPPFRDRNHADGTMKEGLRLPQPMSEGGERLDYASSGVDIDLEGASVASLVGALSRSVRVAGAPGAPVDFRRIWWTD
ncbi:MAG: hypothetical protein Ct9H90mP16_08440 [Candidatus Poseidoniales archaeon]|nr:MAG: hypothetical protein Ct9H90mP16_08440 [Candidatus Poseidoniales archaeon]